MQMFTTTLRISPSWTVAQLLFPHSTSRVARHRALRPPRAAQAVDPAVPRRSGNYPPSLWDSDYLQSLTNDFTEEQAGQIEKLKKRTRRLIQADAEVSDQLELIDVVQQLGLGYHFEDDIMGVLAKIHESMKEVIATMEYDLYHKALLFRLFREHAFNVSEDVFDSLRDAETGSFQSSLCDDTRGLLSLYEASYFVVEADKTMDDARDYTTTHLHEIIKANDNCLDQSLSEKINYALKFPLNWRLNRLHCRWFIERYAKENKMNPILLELAKLDFNMVQSVHQRELVLLSRWWKELDICGVNLMFTRDRLVENYLGFSLYAFEPKKWRCRVEVTKLCVFQGTIDDIYDTYGSMEELQLFTDAVERWDVNAIEKLPHYMKICFLALYNTANEISYKTLRDLKVDIVPYLKKMWTTQCKAHHVEAKWYYKGYIPSFEEYLENARITIGLDLCLGVAHCVNEYVSLEALERFETHLQDLTRSPSIITRLCNDMGTSTHELKRGDVLKSVECYMHEKGVSEAVAQKHMWNLVRLNWKNMNGFKPIATSDSEKLLKNYALNHARSALLYYQDGDGYGMNHSREIKDSIISLFIEPIVL